jgi:hypothetical protein
MAILAADALLLAAIVVGVRWATTRHMRFLPLVVAIGAATAFTLARYHYRLEDSEFLATLAAFCAVTGLTVAVAILGLREGAGRSLAYGALAAGLVPALFVAGIVIRFTLCLLGGAECYGN